MPTRVDLGSVVGPQGPPGDPVSVETAIEECKKLFLQLTGGTLSGNLVVGSATIQTNGYVLSSWLKTTSSTRYTSKLDKIVCLDNSGWLYWRSLADIKGDMGITDTSSTSIDVTVPASGWSTALTSGYYTNRVNVSGLTAADNPIASVVISSATLAEDEREAFGQIIEIETFDGYMIAKALDRPSTSVKVNLLIIP